MATAERAHAEQDGNSLAAEYLEPGEDMWRENQEELWRKEPASTWEDAMPDARDPIASNAWQDDGLPLTVSVQWILKCRCSESSFTGGITAQAPPTAASGEVILHRVHRTAAP